MTKIPNFITMEFRDNDQLRLASEFVQHTGRSIFLTGKAGTGKTTFLHNLKKITPKRMVVVAPTGVAAINAGGVTIHSFFQLGFAPFIPGTSVQTENQDKEASLRKFHREKINLIKCIDLLVIDEISMVRADVLDAVDDVLRRFRDRNKPFGGVQLLMIGDLFQLSPVAKEEEWNILRHHYRSVYFFDSRALQQCDPLTIELVENFRQSDLHFISLLNKVRENSMTPEVISELNRRYQPGFKPDDREGFITLTTHNRQAGNINQERLKDIPHKPFIFTAKIEREFPEYLYPTDFQLELKKDAQVMFIKNDPSAEKLFFNGKIGRITSIDEEGITVKCPADADEISVPLLTWENTRYSLNAETKEIKEEIAGTFTQYPLRLAWAITIHKSQGLTFDKVIIDAVAAFAFGQVYVALSRCRTLEGIVLSTPVTLSGIRSDSNISKYSEEVKRQEPGLMKLVDSKRRYQQDLIFELFDFKALRYRFDALLRQIREHVQSIDSQTIRSIQEKKERAEEEIFRIAERFRIQLQEMLQHDLLPSENQALQERIIKAVPWFTEKIDTIILKYFSGISIESDNKAVTTSIREILEKLEREAFIRHACLKSAGEGFETIRYLKARSGADVDFRSSQMKARSKVKNLPVKIEHAELYQALRNWRSMTADEKNLTAYRILPQKSLLQLVMLLPRSVKELMQVHGLGPARINQYGEEILNIIDDYCSENNIERISASGKNRKKHFPEDTRMITLDLYRRGKTIKEIAEERNLAISTIEAHIAWHLSQGELDISSFVDSEKVEKVAEFYRENPQSSRGAAKQYFGDSITYNELNFILAHLRSNN